MGGCSAHLHDPNRRGRIRSEKKSITFSLPEVNSDLPAIYYQHTIAQPNSHQPAHSPHSINDHTPALSRFTHPHFSTNVIGY